MKTNAVTAYAGNEHAQTILLDAAGKEPRVDSRVIAENIHVQHKNVISLIRSQKSLMVVAQQVATNAMQGSIDHHDGYAAAKSSLNALALAIDGQTVHQIEKAGA